MSIPDDPFGTASAGNTANPSVSNSPADDATLPPHRPLAPPRSNMHGPVSGTSSAGGGKPGSSGAKTPRRVQWTSDSHIVAIAPSAPYAESESSLGSVPPPALGNLSIPSHMHADLDARNRALSPTNSEYDQASLREIESALARHQTQRSAARANLLSARHGVKPPDIEEDITAVTTPGQDNDEDDYDYRLDTTDHHLDPEESEVERTFSRGHQQHGRRFFGTAAGQHSSGLSSAASSIMGDDDTTPANDGNENHQYPPGTAFGPGGPIHPSATGPPPKGLIPEDPDIPDNDIHQHMAVYVDPGETDGMPSMPVHTHAGGGNANDAVDHAQEASALVRAHKSGKFGQFLRNRKKNVVNGISGTANGVTGVATGVATGVVGGVTAGDRARRKATRWLTGTDTKQEEEAQMNAFADRYNEKHGDPSNGIAAGLTGMGAMGARMGASGAMAGGLAGGGVLASLLALYDNGQNGQSGASTPASSRPASLAASDDSDSSDDERERERLRKLRKREEKERRLRDERERKTRKAELKAAQALERGPKPARPTSFLGANALFSGGVGHGRPRGETTTSGGSAPSMVSSPMPMEEGNELAMQQRSTSQGSFDIRKSRDSPRMFKAVKKAADRLGIDVDEDRPKSAISGGGVFGALIQNTGNLSGVATPAASQLVPNARRPGFTLARFSQEADQDLTEQSRPNSMFSSRPASLYARSESHLPLGDNDRGSPETLRDTQVETDGMELLARATTTDDRDMMPRRPNNARLPSASGGLKRPNRPFSLGLGKLGTMPHMPQTPGNSAFKSASHFFSGSRSQPTTPTSAFSDKDSDYFGEKARLIEEEERRRKEEKRRKKKAKEKKRKQEIFVSDSRSSMTVPFGSPSHRLEAQIQATARVLELNCQVVYLPGTCLVSFGDDATHTSETKFLKQATGLDLQKLLATHHIYWDVSVAMQRFWRY
ncbi:hypothetical protein QFC24_003401 [Naganishia onofrii]|uniref:Uncharacterized protein n=1 Tax=Naganishia onofrii TaxID=1851511 RepID=A0ACC2XLV2_9TREE|nr:hypothetical protein QFC24_003401 [Naganishia onofrii]